MGLERLSGGGVCWRVSAQTLHLTPCTLKPQPSKSAPLSWGKLGRWTLQAQLKQVEQAQGEEFSLRPSDLFTGIAMLDKIIRIHREEEWSLLCKAGVKRGRVKFTL